MNVFATHDTLAAALALASLFDDRMRTADRNARAATRSADRQLCEVQRDAWQTARDELRALIDGRDPADEHAAREDAAAAAAEMRAVVQAERDAVAADPRYDGRVI